MKKVFENIKKSVFALALVSSVLFAGCHVGLGDAVDTIGPVVSITAPDFMANVPNSFTASGTASDNEAVTKIVVSFADMNWTYSNGSWDRDGAAFENGEWIVNITLPEAASGEYVLKVSATDYAGNSGKDSVSSRTVVYDTKPPVVTVTNPTKLYKTSDIISSSLASDDYRDFTYISEYLNGEVAIQGYQDEEFNLSEMTLRIADKDGNEYFKQTLTENLRNWNVTVPASVLPTEKTFLQILTKSKDAANNEETEKSNGFFCWWPDADKPWSETGNIEPTSTIPENSQAQYYPGYKFQGQCYDDDGIKTVSVRLYNDMNEEVGKYDYEKAEGDESSTFLSWDVVLPSETGALKIVVNCTDINDNPAETLTGYMKVIDIKIPQIQVLNPKQTESFFGDATGNVTFSGTATDDAGVKELKMVWIKDESFLPLYSDSSYSGWNFTSDSDDGETNLRWNVSLGNGERNGSVVQYEFEKSVNIFDDLGIDGETNKLTNQTFVFRVVDSSDRTNTLTYAVQGDIKKPEFSITKVYVKYSDSDIKEYEPDYASALPTFGGGTQVKVEGTWSDDSTDVWSDKTLVSKSIKIDGLKDATVTANADGTWETSYSSNELTGALSLKATIKDLAGSESVAKVTYSINTDEAAFEKITAENADGTFGIDAKIIIVMKFTKAVTVEGNPVLVLNNGKEVSFKTDTNGTKIHKFEYTVEEGDDTTALNVTSTPKNCTWKDASSNTNVAVAISETNDLKFNKNIAIVTKAPEVKSVSLNTAGDELSVEFTSAIYKNSGNIEIEQSTVTNAPAVLTTAEYNRLKSSLSLYYEKTTNGCDSNGNADLTTKYVLKYEYDSNNTALVNAYKNSGATKITMSVKSSNVIVDSTDKNILKIKLTGTNALPCKGTSYSVKIPASLVSDVIGNKNAADTKSISLGGVEKPVVRVSKGAAAYDSSTKTATQPLTAQFKIDCETPNASIKYAVNTKSYSYDYNADSAETDPRSYDAEVYANLDLGDEENTDYPKQGTAPTAPTSMATSYTTPVTIGTSDNWTIGEKYMIGTEASVNGVSEKAYATANRSLFVFYNDNGTQFKNENQRIWVRGGDGETGGVITAGFPLSWDISDENGVALMTQEVDSNDAEKSYYYYVTWELNTTGYIGVLIAEPKDNGKPLVNNDTYGFAVNAWVPFKKWYCLYPGESRIVNAGHYGYVWGQQRDNLKWNYASGADGKGGNTGGGGASQEEKDLKKMTIVATVAPSSLNGDGVSQTVSCTDEWQRLCVEKWGGDTGTNGSYLVFDVSMASGDEHYIDIWYYSYGNKREFGKLEISSTGTAKLQISDTASNEWKWNNIYIGGKGVTINSVKRYQPTSSNVPVPNASMLTAGAKIKVTTNSDVDSIVDYPGFSVGKQWKNAAVNETYTFTLTQEDVDALKGNANITSLGIGIDKVETPVHTYEWTKLSSVAAGELIQFTVGESDGLVSDSECFVMFDGHKLNVTNGVAEYEFTSSDVSNPWKYTNSSPEIYSYGVSITGQSVKSPYHYFDWKVLSGLSAGDVLEFTIGASDGLVDSSNCYIKMFSKDSIKVTPNSTYKYTVTSADVGNWEFTQASTNKVYGYGVEITGRTVKSPYTELALSNPNNLGYGASCKITVTFEKLSGFDSLESTLTYYNWGLVDSVTLTADDISSGTYTFTGISMNGYTKVIGCGVKILTAEVQNP